MTTGRKAGHKADRTETAVFGGLMTAFLGGSPFVAYAAGRWAAAKLSREAQTQRASLRQVPATLLPEGSRCDGPARGVLSDVPAQWRAPDGQLHTGLVSAPNGAAAGSTMRVWVNGNGELAGSPMRQRQVADRTELAEGLAAALFAVALSAIGWQARRHLDRRQMAA